MQLSSQTRISSMTTMITSKPYHCYYCKVHYYRRELVEMWIVKGGKPVKIIVKSCLDCSPFAKLLNPNDKGWRKRAKWQGQK